MARSKVKSRLHHDVAHLHPLTNVPTKYQHPTPYGFRYTGRTNFFPCPPARTPWVKTKQKLRLKPYNINELNFNLNASDDHK